MCTDMCYHKIPDELYPYDHETYEKYQGDFYSVVTNIETGKPDGIPLRKSMEQGNHKNVIIMT